MDREDTITNPNSSSEKENHHIDNLRLKESEEFTKECFGAYGQVITLILLILRLLSNIESSLADEVASCNSLSTDSFEKLKQSVELYRNSFKKVSPANKSHETKSRQTPSDVKVFKKDEENKPESSDIWAETNQHISRTPLTSLNSAVSVHMKFRTPHSSTNRKPNVRTVQRLPYSIQAQIVKKESPDSYNIRTTAKCLQRGSSSCQRKASRYVPSPDETPDSSDCISLSSIIDL
ncbi:unnamed protein product [Trichobilharzia regenti]|nr:unnamed protein product [Trichobilharzia regenti]